MAYGSPSSTDDVPAYLSDIYEGKPVPEYAMRENIRKYEMVNGVSPSNAIIGNLKDRLQNSLSGYGMKVFLGNKHWMPKIDDALAEMKGDGISRIIAIPLFPFPSNNVRSSYLDHMSESMNKMGYSPELDFINGFNDRKEFTAVWSGIISNGLNSSHDDTAVIFSAHSLPLFRNDENIYDSAYRDSVNEIASVVGIQEYAFGYQSRGKYGDRWLEPSLQDVFDSMDKENISRVLAVPVGFCYEHLEILYDLDIEFGETVKEKGFRYTRTALPDYSEEWVRMFRNIIIEKAGE